MNDQEYTKHYYIEGERICSKIGSGFGVAPYDPLGGPVDVLSGAFSELPDSLLTMVQRSAICAGYEGDITISGELKPAHNAESDPENDQYFYHPDHLGSSSYITDLYGNGIQHLQYLPFGENFVDQQTGQWDTPYKFSGKEKDDETGYSYFGARYYDSELSVWLSVDPLAGKYPSTSPFAYVENNPIMFFDPNGMVKFPTDDDYNNANIGKEDRDRFEKILRRLPELVENNPDALNAFINSSGLDKEQIIGYLKEGSGPQVNIIPNSSDAHADNKDNISIGGLLIANLASIDQADEIELGEQALGMGLLLLDEVTHCMDKFKNSGFSSGEYVWSNNKADYHSKYWGDKYIMSGQQPWKTSPTGHRGTDIQILGFGVGVSVGLDGRFQFRSPASYPIHHHWPGTEQTPVPFNYKAGLNLLR